jgi:hypothetical protein
VSKLTVSIGASDVKAADALLTAAQSSPKGVDLPVEQLGVLPSYQLGYVNYAATGSTSWTSAEPVQLAYGKPPSGVADLCIWDLPESLLNVPSRPESDVPTPPLPCFELLCATVDAATGAAISAPAVSYSWATRIALTVKRLSDIAPTPAGVCTYELVGANEYDVVLLERLLAAAGLGGIVGGVSTLLLLHEASGGTAGLAADAAPSVFISQANLTTVTRPPTLLTRTRVAPPPQGSQTPVDFVRLLWECSITRSGGFYLYYCTDPVEHTGLPSAIFNDRGEATLTLLLLYGAPADAARRNRLAGYVNATVTAGYIDPASTAVGARARALGASALASAQDSLSGLAETYRTPLAELAGANADVTLGAAVNVTAGSYQVRPSSPGGEAVQIAAWFGTSVSALQAANPNVDFSHELPLWATIALPALVVAPGSSERGTLAEIAVYYGTIVAALAPVNAPTQGIFSGQTITTAELMNPTSSDTLAGIAGTYYMDAVQLAQDNASVPFAPGAPLQAAGGMYVVPATAGAGALAAIAARFDVQPVDIERANPELSWSSPQPPLTLVMLPSPLSLKAGTSPQAQTFAQTASFYGVSIASLALENAEVHGLFTVPLRVRGGPLERQPASPAGTLTYGLTRTAAPAPTDTTTTAQLERLYSLLSYRVPADAAPFSATTPGPPLGPLTAPSNSDGEKLRTPYADGLWRYQKAVPYSRLAPTLEQEGSSGPDPAKSPYLGVGGVMRLELQWNDLFGNRGLTPLAEPALDTAAALNRPPARTLYTDPLVGLSEWPSLGYQYMVGADGANGAKLQISLQFDGCSYLVNGEQGCQKPPSPPKVDPIEHARRDMAVYARICYQLAADVPGGITAEVTTSLLTAGSHEIDAAPLRAFAIAIYGWLATRAEGQTTEPFPATEPISVPLALDAIETQQIFELKVGLTLRRADELVDPDMRVESRTAENATPIPPAHGQSGPSTPYTLAAFAEAFEAAMTCAGSWRLKLAAGVDREQAERAGTGAPLWAVRLGLAKGQPLAFEVDNPTAPTSYAPRPISNLPRAGSLQLESYVTGSGLTGSKTSTTFSGVDLDQWMATLLAALDRLLSPAYSAAIGLIDGHLPSGRNPHAQELLQAKQSLAQQLARLVIPVLPRAEGPDQTAARELFAQQLLVQLASFYTIDAVVQFSVSASSQASDPSTSPQLFGDLAQTGQHPAPVTLSAPKVALAQPTSGPAPTLTFLLSTSAGQTDVAQSEAQLTLALDYTGTDVEHQIGALPGIVGYKPSSWLSFVREDAQPPLAAALGPFDVPLVLRGFPVPPSVRSQSGVQSVPDGTSGLQLAQTLLWDYSLVYSEPYHHQQDSVHLTLQFNQTSTQARGPEAPVPTSASDPFIALAQFVSVQPHVQADIDTYVAPVDPSKIESGSTAFVNADVALSTFAKLAAQVTAGLEAGLGACADGAGLAGEEFKLHVEEGTIELESRLQAGEKVEVLLVTVPHVDDVLGAKVEVAIEGCEVQPAPAETLTSMRAIVPNTSTFAYVYVDQTTKEWLTPQQAAAIGPRTVTIPSLNVLTRQDAWTSVTVVRNEHAAEPFRYKSTSVSFASPQYPTNRYTQPPIEVAAIGASEPQKRTPRQHLHALIEALLGAAPAGEQTIQLECRYTYRLAGTELEPIELPVLLLAPTPTDPKKESLSEPIAAAMTEWWKANAPSETAGVFLLNVTIMSELTSQPLIVLANLQLTEQWIDWS